MKNNAFKAFKIALTTTLFLMASLSQASLLLAEYKYTTDLSDSTGNYADATIGGSVSGPDANGITLDGVYGNDVITANISALDQTDFEFKIDFFAHTLKEQPILMGGTGWRWLGLYMDNVGNFGLKYNNQNFIFSSTLLEANTWYNAEVQFEAGQVQLLLNNTVVLNQVIGALNTGNNHNFSGNDLSIGKAFDGSLRNFAVFNNTSFAVAQSVSAPSVLWIAFTGFVLLFIKKAKRAK